MRHSPERSSGGPVVIFADRADWHVQCLRAALARSGVTPIVTPLHVVAVETTGRLPLSIPGCRGHQPRAAMVRGIAPGSFEAISTGLGVLEALEDLGTVVWNTQRAIRRCVDKSATTLALVGAGLPTPPTLVTLDRTRALDFVAREAGAGHRVVAKPLFGSQGRGLRLLHRARDLPDPDEVDGVYYLQRFVPPRDGVHRDFRVFVTAGRAVAGMTRRSERWITNVHQGGRPEPLRVEPAMARLAVAAAGATGAAFAGVDLMHDGQGGLTVIEVNSMPAWQGLQAVSPVDIAGALVSAWLSAASNVPATEAG